MQGGTLLNCMHWLNLRPQQQSSMAQEGARSPCSHTLGTWMAADTKHDGKGLQWQIIKLQCSSDISRTSCMVQRNNDDYHTGDKHSITCILIAEEKEQGIHVPNALQFGKLALDLNPIVSEVV